MKCLFIHLFTYVLMVFSSSAFAELAGSGSYTHKSSSENSQRVLVSEKEHQCLEARKNLEQIFSGDAESTHQSFVEIRDAIQAYKKIDCVYTAGFLFSDQKQVDRYVRYKMQALGRAPARL